ncbi:MAG: putative NAD/FAD-binding protein [Rhodobacteraceae bacterium HLUCCA12]|nr:MAG: putative NAD/FAD-binding protein [Rhodobacteraceae bacterium HLUCCA12]
MPFESPSLHPRRIAVVGGGISGMGAAWLLAPGHQVTLIEAAPRLGGHARTVMAGKRGDQPVDTGFIVFNRVNYPNLIAMFEALDVETVKSNMSFGASFDQGACEYNLNSIDQLFASRRNLADPRFLRMISDIVRFNKGAVRAAADPAMTIGELMDKLRMGRWFRERYLQPFSGAIWSTPKDQIMRFPARAMIRFFENHALLGYHGQHQWFTVAGGSVEYVRKLTLDLAVRGVDIRCNSPVQAIRRRPLGVEIKTHGGTWEAFDEVILATHSDDSLAMLSDPTQDERAALGAVGYQDNHAVLHADPSVMPRRRKCWASWTYTEHAPEDRARISLSYWMNSLQPIPQDDLHIVTLNATRPIDEALIYDTHTFRHPVFDLAAFAAQDRIRDFNGARSTWYCGAWMRNGFHEDGFASAVDVVQALSARTQRMGAAAA